MNSLFTFQYWGLEQQQNSWAGCSLLLGTTKGVFTEETGLMGVGWGWGCVAAVTSPRPRGKASLGNSVELWPKHPFPPGRPPSWDSLGGSMFSFFY